MSLKNKLEVRSSELNQQAQQAREDENLTLATTLKKKAIYFKKVLANIIEEENKYHKNAEISDISKVSSDPVYKNADQSIKDKIINRTLTREEYNNNLPDGYLPEGGYYDDQGIEEDKVGDEKTEEIVDQLQNTHEKERKKTTLKELLTDTEDDINEDDYEEGVEQGKLIYSIKEYFDDSLIGPEAMSIFFEKDYHGKTKKEYIEILYNLPSEDVVGISTNIRNILDKKYEYNRIINNAISTSNICAVKGALFTTIKSYIANYKSNNVLEDDRICKDILIVDLYDLQKCLDKVMSEYVRISRILNSRGNKDGRYDVSVVGDPWKAPTLDYYDNRRDFHDNRGGRGDYYKILNKNPEDN